MAFDVKKALGEIADDLKDKAQEMLDSSQIDDRVARGFRSVARALDGLAGRVDELDSDETDDQGHPEPDDSKTSDTTGNRSSTSSRTQEKK